MTSWILIVGGVAMLVEGCVWARRKGIDLNVFTVILLSIVLPVVDVARLSRFAGRLAWTWLIEPDVAHARIRYARWRNRRQYFDQQHPIARAVIEAAPTRSLPPPPAVLPAPPPVPVVQPLAAGPVATAIQVVQPDGTVRWQPMELYG